MKKFEELERIQKEVHESPVRSAVDNKENITEDTDSPISGKESTPVESQPLTEEQLQEVFKRTSAFTVKSATMESTVDDMDALELWQIEFRENNTDELFEEEQVFLHTHEPKETAGSPSRL